MIVNKLFVSETKDSFQVGLANSTFHISTVIPKTKTLVANNNSSTGNMSSTPIVKGIIPAGG